jgi:hypothetical protein
VPACGEPRMKVRGWAGLGLETRIRAALNEPGRTKGVRKIADEFGISPSTVQAISRPLETSAAAA